MDLFYLQRLCECEIEDFELDKAAEYAGNTEVGLRNYCRASLLSATYEVGNAISRWPSTRLWAA
jgi:hypothetical protein